MRKLIASILLAISLINITFAETNQADLSEQSLPVNIPNQQDISIANSLPTTSANEVQASEKDFATEKNLAALQQEPNLLTAQRGFDQDLSIWSMYQHADMVVKAVMLGLIVASIITWALFFSKSIELIGAYRQLQKEQQKLSKVKSLDDAIGIAATFKKNSVTRKLYDEVVAEKTLSAGSHDLNGTKDRASFRLERAVASISRYMGRGNGYLATIGAISPFIGLFGTVWGIMNSFIGIAHSQTTNLAVVAPGIAEALLATAIGLVAAIPAVVIYNLFARMINTYRGQLGDVAAQATVLLGRDLDLADSNKKR
ncbi:MAG TPA: tonB-system energizer ExbB [Arsenophonus nasoniae]|uniref:tonB-system energizer ExbB n=1 Tax=Arsenophonus nasoniae TaxID=638 RepID=UPI00387A1B06